MPQTRRQSFSEAWQNVAVGFVLSVLLQRYAFAPLAVWLESRGGFVLGWEWEFALSSTVGYTLVSVLRLYIFRRWRVRRGQ